MKIKFLIFIGISFLISACQPQITHEPEGKSARTASTKNISEIIRFLSNELPIKNTNASTFFLDLDSTEIKKVDIGKKQEVKYKRYTFYYDSDSTNIASVWVELNPAYELIQDQLNETFKSDWQPASSNEIDIKTEDAIVHKKYTYSTAKGLVDITVYSKYDKITGILLEFRNKS